MEKRDQGEGGDAKREQTTEEWFLFGTADNHQHRMQTLRRLQVKEGVYEKHV
jgi:hypothetical protein